MTSSGPAELLRTLNNLFTQKYNLLSHFFTCIIVDIDLNEHFILYSSAGHPHQFLTIDTTEPVNNLSNSGQIVGIGINIEYEQTRIQFKEYFRMFLYTDGLYEDYNANQNENDEIFNEKKLRDLFSNFKNLEVEDCIEQILHQSSIFRGKREIKDDTTILGIEMKSEPGK